MSTLKSAVTAFATVAGLGLAGFGLYMAVKTAAATSPILAATVAIGLPVVALAAIVVAGLYMNRRSNRSHDI